MNKEHWNSVYLDGDVSDDILKQMIDMSYGLVLNSLIKKMQAFQIGLSVLARNECYSNILTEDMIIKMLNTGRDILIGMRRQGGI